MAGAGQVSRLAALDADQYQARSRTVAQLIQQQLLVAVGSLRQEAGQVGVYPGMGERDPGTERQYGQPGTQHEALAQASHRGNGIGSTATLAVIGLMCAICNLLIDLWV